MSSYLVWFEHSPTSIFCVIMQAAKALLRFSSEPLLLTDATSTKNPGGKYHGLAHFNITEHIQNRCKEHPAHLSTLHARNHKFCQRGSNSNNLNGVSLAGRGWPNIFAGLVALWFSWGSGSGSPLYIFICAGLVALWFSWGSGSGSYIFEIFQGVRRDPLPHSPLWICACAGVSITWSQTQKARFLVKVILLKEDRCRYVSIWASTCGFGTYMYHTCGATKAMASCSLMLRLHYVPGGLGSHDFGHRGRNGVTVTQRRGTGSTDVARRGCRDRRDRFLNSLKICQGSHSGIGLLKCAVVERGERNKTWPNVTYLNTTWSMSVAGRLVTEPQHKVYQGLSRSIKLCCGLPRCPNPTPQLEPEHWV